MGWGDWGDWSDVPQEWSDDGSAEGVYTKIYSSVAVKIWSGTWQPGWQKWLYNGHICGGGAVRLKNTPPAGSHGWGCYCHFLELAEEYNGENFYFTTNEPDPERMGCVPHSGPDEDYSGVYSVHEALANIMINLIGGYVSFAWAAAATWVLRMHGMDGLWSTAGRVPLIAPLLTQVNCQQLRRENMV